MTVEIRGQKPLPFQSAISNGNLQIEIPWYASLSLDYSYFTRKLYDGKQFIRHGVLPAEDTVKFSLPLSSRITVRAEGRRWTLSVPASHSKIKHVFQRKFLGISLAMHMALCLVAWAVLIYSGAKLKEPIKIAQPSAVLYQRPASGKQPSEPFSGIFFGRFRNVQIDKNGTASERLANLTGLLPSVRGAIKIAGKENLTGKTVPASTLVSSRVAAQRFRVAAETETVDDNLNQEDKNLILQTFGTARGKLQHAYSQALLLDPDLAVTVSFEMAVNPQGHVKLTHFQTSGKGKAQGIAKLKEGFERVIEGISIEKRFSGLRIRGENAFVQ